MINHIVGQMTIGMAVAAQEPGQVRQTLIYPGLFIGVLIEMNQVLELMGKSAFIQIRPGSIRAGPVSPVIGIDMHYVLVVFSALAG